VFDDKIGQSIEYRVTVDTGYKICKEYENLLWSADSRFVAILERGLPKSVKNSMKSHSLR